MSGISKQVQILTKIISSNLLLGDVDIITSCLLEENTNCFPQLIRSWVRNNPGTTKTQTCHKPEATGTLNTVNRVLHLYGLRGYWARRTLLLQNPQLQAGLKSAADHMDKEKAFWRKVLCSDKTKIKLFGHNDQRYKGTLYQLLNMVMVVFQKPQDSSAEPQTIRQLKLGHRCVTTAQWPKTYIKAGRGMDKDLNNKNKKAWPQPCRKYVHFCPEKRSNIQLKLDRKLADGLPKVSGQGEIYQRTFNHQILGVL